MEAIKDFLQSPVQSYLNLLDPGPDTAIRLYKIATILGMAASITAVATYALFLLGPMYITLPTALLLKKICIIGVLASAICFLGGTFAKMSEDGPVWRLIYAVTIVVATFVPAILLMIYGIPNT